MRACLIVLLLLSLARGGWIDPDTPLDERTTTSFTDQAPLNLVFSDEFNVPGRSFRDGHDPRWTAMHKDDYTNYALQFYHQDLVTTSNGFLNISTLVEDVTFDINDELNAAEQRKTKNYQSGMIQGWNKFCFTGGILEVRARLPGKASIGGMWPAMWLLGNLARATYVGSSNNVWPWSYDTCSEELQKQQLFSKCNLVNHFNLHPLQGRGAPEIDLLEAMPGKETLQHTPINKPYFSTSLQVAPGSTQDDYRPTVSETPAPGYWYEHGLHYGPNTSLNIFFYGMHLSGATKQQGYTADAISANTNLSDTHFDSFHTYRLEWEPYSQDVSDADDADADTNAADAKGGGGEKGETDEEKGERDKQEQEEHGKNGSQRRGLSDDLHAPFSPTSEPTRHTATSARKQQKSAGYIKW